MVPLSGTVSPDVDPVDVVAPPNPTARSSSVQPVVKESPALLVPSQVSSSLGRTPAAADIKRACVSADECPTTSAPQRKALRTGAPCQILKKTLNKQAVVGPVARTAAPMAAGGDSSGGVVAVSRSPLPAASCAMVEKSMLRMELWPLASDLLVWSAGSTTR